MYGKRNRPPPLSNPRTPSPQPNDIANELTLPLPTPRPTPTLTSVSPVRSRRASNPASFSPSPPSVSPSSSTYDYIEETNENNLFSSSSLSSSSSGSQKKRKLTALGRNKNRTEKTIPRSLNYLGADTSFSSRSTTDPYSFSEEEWEEGKNTHLLRAISAEMITKKKKTSPTNPKNNIGKNSTKLPVPKNAETLNQKERMSPLILTPLVPTNLSSSLPSSIPIPPLVRRRPVPAASRPASAAAVLCRDEPIRSSLCPDSVTLVAQNRFDPMGTAKIKSGDSSLLQIPSSSIYNPLSPLRSKSAIPLTSASDVKGKDQNGSGSSGESERSTELSGRTRKRSNATSGEKTAPSIRRSASSAAASSSVSRSNSKTRLSFLSFAPSTSSSSEGPTFTGQNRRLMDEMQYLLDGIKSPEISVRHQSALKLTAFFRSDESKTVLNPFSSAAQFGSCATNQKFSLLRSSGGLKQFFTCFTVASSPLLDEIICMNFASCMYMMSKEKANAAFITAEGAKLLLRVMKGAKDEKKNEIDMNHAEMKNGEETNKESSNRVRSKRAKKQETVSIASNRTFEADPLLLSLSLPINASLLALLSLHAFASDTHFKSVVSDSEIMEILPFLLFTHFNSLHSLSNKEERTTPVSEKISESVFYIQAIVSILESLTNTHSHNQSTLLNSTFQTPVTLSYKISASNAVSVLSIPNFASLLFLMLHYFAERWFSDERGTVNDSNSKRINTPNHRRGLSDIINSGDFQLDLLDSENLNMDDDLVDFSVVKSFALASTSNSEIVELLFRLLVNLTNKSSRGAEIVLTVYPAVSMSNHLVKNGESPDEFNGLQLIASIVSRSWYQYSLQMVQRIEGERQTRSNRDYFDLLSLALGILINTCEQSKSIRRYCIEECRVSLPCQVTLDETTAASSHSFLSLSQPFDDITVTTLVNGDSSSSSTISWIDCCIDIFIKSYIQLDTISRIEEAKEQFGREAVDLNEKNGVQFMKDLELPPPTQQHSGGQYGKKGSSNKSSEPSISSSALHLRADVASAPSFSLSGLSPSVEHSLLCYKIVCSYAAMILALLASDDQSTFSLIQSSMRNRPENAAHYQSLHSINKRNKESVTRSPSAPLSLTLLSTQPKTPTLSPQYSSSQSLDPPRSPHTPSSPISPTPLIFSLRLLVRILNEFLLFQSSTSMMSEESIEGIIIIIQKIEKRIKAGDTYSI